LTALEARLMLPKGAAVRMTEYADLIHHMEWADARLWRAVLNEPSLSADRDMRERFYHFHSTQWAFGQVLCGHPIEIPELTKLPDLRSIGLWARRFYSEIAVELARFGEPELSRTVEFPWAADVAKRFEVVAPATVRDSLLQIVLHTAHHRGQIMTRLREAGGVPPMTDFIGWVWMGRPAPDWSLLEAA
jgi:uncharacterized damage-inducible protein DinB